MTLPMFSKEIMRVCQPLRQSLSRRALHELKRSYSTVSVGKHFEKSAVFALTRLSFDLTVCGGPKDRGVDFRGKWRLKDSYVPVVGQCRKYKKRLGPRHVREMEGVLGRESVDTLGILVSAQGFTKDAYDACMGSPYSLALTVLQGSIDSDLDLGSTQALEGGGIVNAIEGWDATDGDKTLNSACSVPAKCSRGLLKPHQSQESQGGSNENIECFGENVQNNKKMQENKIALNNHQISNAQNSTTCTMISNETDLCKDMTELPRNDRNRGDQVDQNKDFVTFGQITLFELNPAARQLLPHVFVGITYKGKHTRNPEIMFVEDDSILYVKTE